MKNRLINTFDELSRRLSDFGATQASNSAIAKAVADNPWFTPDDIVYSVKAISNEMLNRDKLIAWMDRCDFWHDRKLDIGVIAAGNIPLAGFFDILCVLISGNRCFLKPSSKDKVLIDYVCGILRDISPEIPIFPYDDRIIPDAVIATGSSNTNRYFVSEFKTTPSILRSGRGSIAVLSGTETEPILNELAHDIFSYSGLGCRNVSMIFVPSDYNTDNLCEKLRLYDMPINPHYLKNYLQRKAVLSLGHNYFIDGGFFVLTEGVAMPSALSEIVIYKYVSIDEVDLWLKNNDDTVQCVVSDLYHHVRGAKIGCAQSPALEDYPDGKDVMAFIKKLQSAKRRVR